jgi:hypothetical protein
MEFSYGLRKTSFLCPIFRIQPRSVFLEILKSELAEMQEGGLELGTTQLGKHGVL